jgi:hypothetical protein
VEEKNIILITYSLITISLNEINISKKEIEISSQGLLPRKEIVGIVYGLK